MSVEPLDSETHSSYLEQVCKTLNKILSEIKDLRGDVQELTKEIGGLDRG
jgi:hypothetical protein